MRHSGSKYNTYKSTQTQVPKIRKFKDNSPFFALNGGASQGRPFDKLPPSPRLAPGFVNPRKLTLGISATLREGSEAPLNLTLPVNRPPG